MNPKRQFGQNFLISPHYVDKIINSLDAKQGETLVEIGPGKGALSAKLVEKNYNYVMIEADRDMAAYINKKFAGRNYSLYNADAVKFDYSKIIGDFHAVGNLPYNVGTLIIKRLLFESPRLKTLVCMLQKEVADRICAAPNGKEIGFLSILCQYFADIKRVCTVPPGAFFPAPKVHSTVLKLEIKAEKALRIPKEERSAFFDLVSLGYSQRRKKLKNVISASVDARAEELSVEDWLEIYSRLNLNSQ